MIQKLCNKFMLFLGLFLFSSILIAVTLPPQRAVASVITVDKERTPDLYTKNVTLVRGKTFTLRVKNLKENAKISFRSGDSEIASVNDDGVITAQSVGSTTITVTIRDDSGTTSLSCDVKVGPPAFSVKMTRNRIFLGLNQNDMLGVILKPSNTAENAIFSSYDSSIASVSSGGRITGNKIGLTYAFASISALDGDGERKYDICSIIVVNADDIPSLEEYLSTRSELKSIPDWQLNEAISSFFISLEESKTPVAATAKSAAPANTTADTSVSLVKSLDQYLDSTFNFAAIRKSLEESNTKTSK